MGCACESFFTYSVDEVELPGVRVKELESNRVGVRVQRQGDLHAEVHNHEALGTKRVGEDLDGIADEQAGPCE